MDMEKIMAYVEKIAENLEGLVCAIGCDSMPSASSILVIRDSILLIPTTLIENIETNANN